ncbi:HAD-IA family hydrolase [Pseudonocardia sp. KRD291]|uniref:HAD-IA family hydrolase n=1 Tax=Pseudonocardia sp. KRD291 TaxID=2792007 RepID=UPI001C49C9F1|nr:HAD-IA family hydrolase [Pseudonocardia sp. KRD291]MBW0102597.1 HAD-IA family hydrolase [Pseudonocardia sp. KRD291]
MTAAPGPTVVFDLGEVLVPSSGLERALAAELGVDEPALRDAYWAHRLRHDLGEEPLRYWTAVFTALGMAPEPERMARAEALDVAHWSALPPASTLMIGELARMRVRLALLSNAPRGLAAAVRAASWSGPFDRLLFSADVGVAKPSADIYRRADHEFRTAPEQVVFFDDRDDNVRAARAHGWDAHVWRGAAAAMTTLRSRGIPRPARG